MGSTARSSRLRYASTCIRFMSLMRTSRLAFDLEDLSAPVFHQIMVPLHDLPELLLHLLRHVRALHHLLELPEARHFHLGHERPVTLTGEVGHESHGWLVGLLHDLAHRLELVDQRADLAR